MPLFLDPLYHFFSLDPDDSHGPFIFQAFLLGAEAAGSTAPNPAVGAVVVTYTKEGKPLIVGRGKTQPGGRPHAEDMALTQAGEGARGATLYVTLEPCCHAGQGPSCVSRILESGIKRVVCGFKDPDPRMSGAGFAVLEHAGIKVIYDPRMEVWGRKAHAGHRIRITCGRPEVTLKLACTVDGYVGARGRRLLISEGRAQSFTHGLRAHSDALMVGVGTVIADNPQLTVRDPEYTLRRPVRIVLDSTLRIPIGSTLVQTAIDHPTWVITRSSSSYSQETRLVDYGVRVLRIEDEPGDEKLTMVKILNVLGREGITSVLSEGGIRLAHALIAHNLVDYFIALVNHRTAEACVEAKGLEFLKPSHLVQQLMAEHKGPLGSFSQETTLDLGNDKAFIFEAQGLLCSQA